MACKILFYQNRNSHYKDKTVSQPSFPYNGNNYNWKDGLYIETGRWSLVIKMTSIYHRSDDIKEMSWSVYNLISTTEFSLLIEWILYIEWPLNLQNYLGLNKYLHSLQIFLNVPTFKKIFLLTFKFQWSLLHVVAISNTPLTHWVWEKLTATLWMTFSEAFSWIKMYEFQLKLHWSLLLRVKLTIFHHWFR